MDIENNIFIDIPLRNINNKLCYALFSFKNSSVGKLLRIRL